MAPPPTKRRGFFLNPPTMHSNNVTLIDYMGSDRTHAVNAWASTFLDLELDLPDDIHARTDALTDAILANAGRKRDVRGLLKFLADNGHASPFRSSKFLFAMTEDIATHIHLLKHHVAIEHENAESARYKELKEDKFYLPADWLEYGDEGAYWYRLLKLHTERGNSFYHKALADLTAAGMPRDRAKETARYFKAYNTQINVMRSLSFDGLVQVWQKRGAHTKAQREVAAVVEAMVEQVRRIPGEPFKHSLEAWGMG